MRDDMITSMDRAELRGTSVNLSILINQSMTFNGTNVAFPKTVSKVLEDAEIIYKYLIKDMETLKGYEDDE